MKDDSSSTVDKQWSRHFLNHYSDLYKARQKPLELKQKLFHDSEVILN